MQTIEFVEAQVEINYLDAERKHQNSSSIMYFAHGETLAQIIVTSLEQHGSEATKNMMRFLRINAQQGQFSAIPTPEADNKKLLILRSILDQKLQGSAKIIWFNVVLKRWRHESPIISLLPIDFNPCKELHYYTKAENIYVYKADHPLFPNKHIVCFSHARTHAVTHGESQYPWLSNRLFLTKKSSDASLCNEVQRLTTPKWTAEQHYEMNPFPQTHF